MWDWLGAALGGLKNKGLDLIGDPNFLKYLGGAGSLFGQGASAGQALDPSAMISGQQEQQAIGQLLGGGSPGMGTGGGSMGMAPSGQSLLPSGGAAKLGSVLSGVPGAVGEVVEPAVAATTGAVSPVIQEAPQAAGGGVQDIMGLVSQLAGGMGGGMPGMMGGGMPMDSGAQVVQGGHPGLEGPVGGGMQRGAGGGGAGAEMTPTPIGTAGPDSVVTKQTADGTTTTVQTPSEKNLSTFGTTTPPEALSGEKNAARRANLIGPWPGYEEAQRQHKWSPSGPEHWQDPDVLETIRRRDAGGRTSRPSFLGLEYGKHGQHPLSTPIQMGVGATTGGLPGMAIPFFRALLGQ